MENVAWGFLACFLGYALGRIQVCHRLGKELNYLQMDIDEALERARERGNNE